MPIAVSCTCGQRYQAREDHAGRILKCPACGTDIGVPTPPPRVRDVYGEGRERPSIKSHSNANGDAVEDRDSSTTSNDEFVSIRCPNQDCKALFNVEPQHYGLIVPCPSCGNKTRPIHPNKMPSSVVGVFVLTILICAILLANAVVCMALPRKTSQMAVMLPFLTKVSVAGLIVWGFVSIGIYQRNKLAWQFGRYIGLLNLIATAFFGLVGVLISVSTGAIALALIVVAFPVATSGFFGAGCFVSLGDETARRYFKLVCPVCGALRVRPRDFLFRKCECVHCQYEFPG